MVAALDVRMSTDQHVIDEGDPLMVPVEVTAFGLLAVCVILLAGVLFVTLVFPSRRGHPRPVPCSCRR
jgi:hypothetical protein